MHNLDVLDLLATGLATYGPSALGLMMMLAPLGVPLPTAFVLLAVGAMSRQGIVPVQPMAAVALAGALVGDGTAYAIGRLASGWVHGHLGETRGPIWNTVQERLERDAGVAVYLTRFVLTPLPLVAPTNVMAGASDHVSFARFALGSLLGRLTWLGLYGGIGYVLGSQWEPIGQCMSRYGGWIGAGVAVMVVLARALVQTRRDHTSRNRPQGFLLGAVAVNCD